MQRAQGQTNKTAKQIESRLAKMNGAVAAQLANVGKGLVGGLVGGGIAGVVASIATVANGIASIGDEARRAGTTTEVFQEWKFVAEQARIPLDAMVDALKELNIRADEFATTGKGSAAEAFARLGMTPAEIKERLKDPSALMLELMERTRLLGDTAAGVRIFDELFGGTGGERLVGLLAQSDAEVRATIQSAHELGLVINDEVIAGAAELDRKFNLVKSTVGTGLKTAIVEAARALGDFIDKFRDIENRTSIASLSDDLVAMMEERARLESSMARAREMAAAAPEGIAKGYAEQGVADLDRQIRELEIRMNAVNDRIIALRNPPASPSSSSFKPSPYTPPLPTAAKESPFAREARQIRDATAELVAQQAAIAGLNPLINDYGFAVERAKAEQELLNAANQEGLTITPALAAQIAGLAEQYAQATVEVEQTREAQQQLAAAWGMVGEAAWNAFESVIDGAQSAKEAVLDLIKQILLAEAKAQFMSAFGGGSGGGPLSAILGAFSGGGGGFVGAGGIPRPGVNPFIGRAGGGPVRKGTPYIVGEKRPELFVPNQNGMIIPKIPPAITQSGGGPSVLQISVDVSGARGNAEIEQMVSAGVERGLRSYDQGLPDRMASIRQHPRRR